MEKSLKFRHEDGKLIVTEAVQFDIGDQAKVLLVDAKPEDVSRRLDLYKLEYQQTQEHYRDGYRAVWTNFSYISIAVGAILGFGSRAASIHISFLMILSAALYLFWWAATFKPLDDYGEQRAKVLAEIEAKINEMLHSQVLTHWTRLNAFREKRRWRVKNIVNYCFVPIIVAAFVASLIWATLVIINPTVAPASGSDIVPGIL